MLYDFFITAFEVFVVYLVIYENHRINHECLTAFRDFVFHKIVELEFFTLRYLYGLDRFSARRHLVDYRHVQVAVKGHGKCAWNRCGGHHENMRRQSVAGFSPKSCPLVHAETMLLVDDGKSEVMEHYRIFQQCMGSDDYPCLAFREVR